MINSYRNKKLLIYLYIKAEEIKFPNFHLNCCLTSICLNICSPSCCYSSVGLNQLLFETPDPIIL